MRWIWVALLVAGCSVEPAVVGDRGSPKFQADLAACRESSAKSVYEQNVKHVLSWMTSPLRQRGQMRRAVSACMVGRGYKGEA